MAMIDHLSTLQMHYSSCFKGKNIHTHFNLQIAEFFGKDQYTNMIRNIHNVQKSEKSLIQHCYVYTFSGQKFIKMPKNVNFVCIWSLWLNSVTRLVKFNGTKIGKKCQNCKFKWDIFGHFQSMYKSVNCLLLSLSLPNKRYTIRFQK